MSPKFEELGTAHPAVEMVKVDIDINQESADIAKISGVPTFVLFIDSKFVEKYSGDESSKLRHLVEKAVVAA
jgi:thioredoxin-like negative regulator of GroEL